MNIHPSIFSRLFQLVRHVRLTPYDVSTPAGRVSERYRKLAWATITSGLSKGASLLLVFLTVSAGTEQLGAERFGLWMTIMSIITLLSFADLGVSNGLISAVSEASGHDDWPKIRQFVSSGLAMMTAISLVILAVFFCAYPFIDWGRLINVVEARSVTEAGPSVAIYVSIFLVSMPLSVVQKVQVALQDGWVSNIWQFVGQIGAILGFLLVLKSGGGVPSLVIAVAGIPMIAMALNFLVYFFLKKNAIKPGWHLVDRARARQLGAVGVLFLTLQFMAVIGNASDNIIIAHILGADQVSSFSVTQRLAMILGIAQLFISPLWPIFGEALSRKEYAWARGILTKALLLSVALGLMAACFLIMQGEQVIVWWAGAEFAPSKRLIAGFAVFSMLLGVGGVLSVFLNNATYLRSQAGIYVAASLVSMVLKVVLITHWQDPSGAIWGTVIGYSLIFVAPALFIAYSDRFLPKSI
jgi:O-antigen/teichoic acid export membrane protein